MFFFRFCSPFVSSWRASGTFGDIFGCFKGHKRAPKSNDAQQDAAFEPQKGQEGFQGRLSMDFGRFLIDFVSFKTRFLDFTTGCLNFKIGLVGFSVGFKGFWGEFPRVG